MHQKTTTHDRRVWLIIRNYYVTISFSLWLQKLVHKSKHSSFILVRYKRMNLYILKKSKSWSGGFDHVMPVSGIHPALSKEFLLLQHLHGCCSHQPLPLTQFQHLNKFTFTIKNIKLHHCNGFNLHHHNKIHNEYIQYFQFNRGKGKGCLQSITVHQKSFSQ